MGRFDADSTLLPFLGGINAAQGERIRQHFVDFLCTRTGGPCLYLGQDMPRAHRGLPITDAHFDRVMGHFRDALVASRVAAGARGDLLALLSTLKPMIIQTRGSSSL